MNASGEFSDVPIFVDASVSDAGFPMTRCSFLLIESSDPMPGWSLGLWNSMELPFLMLSLTGIVQGPFDAPRFWNPSLIEDFFATVERYRSPANPGAEFIVETGDFWLPDSLFQKREAAVGDVFRVPLKLFSMCLAYREGTLDERRFLAACEDYPDPLNFSVEETKAFAAWHEQQVEQAREAFPKNPESELKRTDGLMGVEAGML